MNVDKLTDHRNPEVEKDLEEALDEKSPELQGKLKDYIAHLLENVEDVSKNGVRLAIGTFRS